MSSIIHYKMVSIGFGLAFDSFWTGFRHILDQQFLWSAKPPPALKNNCSLYFLMNWFHSFKTEYNNKNHWARYSVQPEPPKKSPSRNPESEGRRVSALVISEGVLVEQNTARMWFLFLSRDSLNLYFHGELFLFSYNHLPKVFQQ